MKPSPSDVQEENCEDLVMVFTISLTNSYTDICWIFISTFTPASIAASFMMNLFYKNY